MARRSRSGVIDDIFAIAIRIPWWASVGIAIALYLVLHPIATSEPPPVIGTADIGRAAGHGLFRSIAAVLQYVLPFAFLLGAAIGYFKQRRVSALADTVATSESPASLSDMSWQEFEQLVGEAFRRQGYSIAETGGGGADGGVDLVLTKGSEKTLVQCKQWRAQRVGVNIVRELYGVMVARHAAAGIIVTAGEFTPDAIEFARGRNVRLIAGRELRGLLRETSKPGQTGVPIPVAPACDSTPPRCPRCGASMIQRVARRGVNAGHKFWGCSQYPSCRGTLDLGV